jgi:hypothetical protein
MVIGARSCIVFLLLALVLAGCARPLHRALGWVGFGPTYAGKISEEELRNELASYGQRFSIAVMTTADRIADQVADRPVRKLTIEWKLRMLPAMQLALGIQDPQESYVSLLTLAIGQRKYLTEGEGAKLFGSGQAEAAAAAMRLVDDALGVGARFLTEKEIEGVRWQVEDLTWQYPIRGVFQSETVVRGFSQAESSGTFDWVASVPMAPFRALEGVDTAAQAIRDFNVTAREFASLVAILPDRVAWQMQLLLYDVEDRETMQRGLTAFESLAASSERVTATAERLPAELRGEMTALLAEVSASQGELRSTLAEAREGLAGLDVAMTQAATLSGSLATLAAQVERAGTTWRGVVDAARGPADVPAAESGRSFDILDYERTAGRIESAATELRGLVQEIHGVQRGLGTFVDGLVLRAAGLLVLFFVLCLAYRRFGAG